MKLYRGMRRKEKLLRTTAGDWGFRRLIEDADRALAYLENRKKRAERYRE